ncbi:hypothetical protein [Kitasatospora sp. McL0602]|uniref:hypothetical protein n=1 Tax=Kitasatospora sp. McL0602 TaxID=3439530 RepID=UPI003F893C63
MLTDVTAGDALLVSLKLTSTTPGTVTVTDTAGDSYAPVGDVTDAYGHRTMVFAAVHAKPLTTVDRITAAYPHARKYHVAVDEFRGVGAAGRPVTASGLFQPGSTAFSTSRTPLACTPGDLLLSAVGTNTGPAPEFAAGWRTLPVIKLSSYRLSTWCRFVSTPGECAATGTTTARWEAVPVALH